MAALELVIGNKNYSSWSMRPWLALKLAGVEFKETRVPLFVEGYEQELSRYTPAGKVPVLMHDDIAIWDSLAICEYAAERYPDQYLWPEDRLLRSRARALAAEMHAGFAGLRASFPMNCRAQVQCPPVAAEITAEIVRIQSIWRDCLDCADGPFLFDRPGIVDAFYAPVVSRFITYDMYMDAVCQSYAEAVMALPPMQQWYREAAAESEHLPRYEIGEQR